MVLTLVIFSLADVDGIAGEPGVGKTAVAEGLAYRIASEQVPKHLKGTLYNLDLGALFAGANAASMGRMARMNCILSEFCLAMTVGTGGCGQLAGRTSQCTSYKYDPNASMRKFNRGCTH